MTLFLIVWAGLGLLGLGIQYVRWWKLVGFSPDIDNYKQFLFILFVSILLGPISFYSAVTNNPF
jgi:hypothetical protein